MEEEFEAVLLHCGHSISTYNGVGVCSKCNKKNCGRCLTWINAELLCPRCFHDRVNRVRE